jgi:hypothetical protein
LQLRLETLEDRCLLSNVPPAGITDWWPGDGNAEDILGGRNGTLVGGATTAPGLVDYAFSLSGNGAYVNVPDSPALNVGTGNFTLGLWAKFNTTANEQVLVEKYIEALTPASTGWTLTKLSNNVLRLALTDGGADPALNVNSSPLTLPLNTWIYFAARRSGSTITTFVNGQAVASGTCAYNLDATSSLKFGHRGNPTDTPGSTDTRQFYLNGGIDEVQLYLGTALTNTQILGIYNDGAAGESKPMVVIRTNPADGAYLTTPPTDFAVHFSEAPASVPASALTVNGIGADSVTQTGTNDVTFHYNTSPVTAQGLQTMAMAAGSVTAADTTLPASYQPLEAWTETFRYDAVLMQVSSTNPAVGGLLTLNSSANGAVATLQLTFNEAVDPTTVSTTNLTLSQGTVTAVSVSPDDTSVTYTLSGLTEGSVNVGLAAGVLNDAYGNPMPTNYSATYGVDIGTVPFPTPLLPVNPDGSLVYQGSTTGLWNATGTSAGDVDNYTINLDANQTLALSVNSAAMPAVSLSYAGSPVAPGAGGVNPIAATDTSYTVSGLYPIAASGTYTISVQAPSGLTTGSYTIQATLNAQLDTDSDGSVSVQSLAPSILDVDPGPGINRAAALGSVEKAVARISTATAGVTNDLRGSWDESGTSTTWAVNGSGNPNSPLKTGVAGTLSKNTPSNSFSFYGRGGDVVTLTTRGSSSGGGTLSQVLLTLQDPSGVQTTGTQVSGSSSDYTIANFTLLTTGTYTVTVGTGQNGKGSYTLTASLVTPANPRPNAADVYSISATAGQYLSFGVATGHSLVRQPQAQLALYAPGVDPITGTPVATSSARGTLDGLLDYDPTTSGTYEVKVTAGPGLAAGSVSYGLAAVSNGSFGANGANGSFATAQDISGRPGAVAAQRRLTTTFVPAGSGKLNEPVGMAYGPDGNLYVASLGTNSILRYNPTTGAFLGTFVSSGSGGLSHPTGLFFGPDGKLYVVSQGNNSVLRYSGTTGAFLDTFVSSGSGGLSEAQRAAFGPDGYLYVSSGNTNNILRYNGSTGAFLGSFVSAGSGGLVRPHDFLFAPDGYLYVASNRTNQVLRYSATTGRSWTSSSRPAVAGSVRRPT